MSDFWDDKLVRALLIVLGVLVTQLIVNRFVGRVVRRLVISHRYKTKREEMQREDTLSNMFKTAAAIGLWIIATILILRDIGVDIGAIATGAGLIGIVVGFGAQSMIKDFLSGMFIILENQYRIGDVVTIGGHSGLVEHVTIRMTKLRDLDGSVFFVPNGQITTVKNMTLEYSGLIIDVGVSYNTDIEKAKEIMNKVGQEMAEDEEWRSRIVEPVTYLRLDSFGDSGVNLKAVGKTTPIDQWDVAGEYRTRLKKAFEKNGIEIPFPQRVVHYANKSEKSE